MRRAQRKEAIAKHFKVNPRTVLNWIKEGCPNSRKNKQVPYTLAISEVEKWLEKKGRTAEPGRPIEGGSVNEGLRKARLKLTIEQALIQSLRRKEMEGSLHNVAECRARRLKQIYAIKQELHALIRNLPEELVNQPKEVIKGKLTEQVERICKKFAEGTDVETNSETLETSVV